nr:MAG TPA: hypothetical protein [Bacteriophage sp.]
MKIAYRGKCVRIIALNTEREIFMLQRIEDYVRVYDPHRTILQGRCLYVGVSDEAEFEKFKRTTYFKAKHMAQAESRKKFESKILKYVILQENDNGKWMEIDIAQSLDEAKEKIEKYKIENEGYSFSMKMYYKPA